MLQNRKKQLKELAKLYELKRIEFSLRQDQLINQFNLKKSERRQVCYGMLAPSDRSLKKYTDILNSDSQLNKLHDEIKNILLAGNILIIKIIKDKDITISGYDINSFIESPDENFQEIDNLMKSLNGYNHIHMIGEKIALEIPARYYLKNHYKIRKLVDFWIRELRLFRLK